MAKHKTSQTQVRAKPKKAAKQLDYGGLVSTMTQGHSQTQRQAVQLANLALTLRNWLVGYYSELSQS